MPSPRGPALRRHRRRRSPRQRTGLGRSASRSAHRACSCPRRQNAPAADARAAGGVAHLCLFLQRQKRHRPGNRRETEGGTPGRGQRAETGHAREDHRPAQPCRDRRSDLGLQRHARTGGYFRAAERNRGADREEPPGATRDGAGGKGGQSRGAPARARRAAFLEPADRCQPRAGGGGLSQGAGDRPAVCGGGTQLSAGAGVESEFGGHTLLVWIVPKHPGSV